MTIAAALRAYAGLGVRIAAHRLGSDSPFKITVALTQRCDCRCRACGIWKKPQGQEMSAEEIGGLLASVPSLRWVNLTGGEPFLREDLVEVAETVVRALPRLAVLDLPTTGQRTGTIVSCMKRIAALKVPRCYVTVSLEGPPAVHDRLRGREGAFARMVETFAALRPIEGVRVYLGMTLSSENAHLVEAALRAVGDRLPAGAGTVGWRDLHLNVFTRSDHYYANRTSTVEPPAAAGRAVDKALRAREGTWEPTDLIEATYLRHIGEYLRTGRSPLPCRALRASVFIDAAGDVYPCTAWDHRLGSALECPLDAVLSTPEARAARAVVARDACPGCWSPCEAHPTIVATAPESVLRRRRRAR